MRFRGESKAQVAVASTAATTAVCGVRRADHGATRRWAAPACGETCATGAAHATTIAEQMPRVEGLRCSEYKEAPFHSSS